MINLYILHGLTITIGFSKLNNIHLKHKNKKTLKPGTVAHACNSTTQEAETEAAATLRSAYIVSSSPARATE